MIFKRTAPLALLLAALPMHGEDAAPKPKAERTLLASLFTGGGGGSGGNSLTRRSVPEEEANRSGKEHSWK